MLLLPQLEDDIGQVAGKAALFDENKHDEDYEDEPQPEPLEDEDEDELEGAAAPQAVAAAAPVTADDRKASLARLLEKKKRQAVSCSGACLMQLLLVE